MRIEIVLLALLPLVAWAELSSAPAYQNPSMEDVWPWVQAANDAIAAYLAEQPATTFLDEDFIKHVDGSPRNLILDPLINFIRSKLTYEIDIPSLGREDIFLYVENGTIFGLNETTIDLDSPMFGYEIRNLTVVIPELEIYADKYILNHFNLGGLVVLNGEGPLHITLNDVEVYAKMNMRFTTNPPLTVTSMTGLKIYIGDCLLDLDNLGASGDAVSSLLNGIGSKVFPQLVRALSNDLQPFITEDGAKCTNNMELICGLLTAVITALYHQVFP